MIKMNKKIEAALHLLRCPRTGTALHIEGSELVSAAGERYPIINGKPILVRNVMAMHITPPDESIISQNFDVYVPHSASAAVPGLKIHLGSGNVPCDHPDVLSVDILPTHNTDIVAEAEALPFADGSIAWVESDAVFEHLYDPFAAISEMRRVLKGGGGLMVDTAFMQGYHGFPGHYFNMTPQAAETFLVDDFELVESIIPFKDRASNSIENSLHRFIEGLHLADRHQILGMPVGRFIDALRDTETARTWFNQSSEYSKRALAAGVSVIARKPADYEQRKAEAQAKAGADHFSRIKREYYAARIGLQLRHHECEFYRLRTIEVEPDQTNEPCTPNLEQALQSGTVSDSLSPVAWQEAISRLLAIDEKFTEVRDLWIRRYMPVSDNSIALNKAFIDPIDYAQSLEALLETERSKNAALQEEVIAMRQSSSWKLTKPIRRLSSLLRRA
ncbi:methyltransferase domain-containing protein [Rhodococcus sp. IEGM1300]